MGINGTGVTIAIIDQPLSLDHPEYKENIIAYKNFDEEHNSAFKSSMHGPAVTSVLVGKTVGVAPKSKVIYAAAPSWKKSLKYYVDAVNWIIEENKKLPEGNKVKVISISADPAYVASMDNIEEYDTYLAQWRMTEEYAKQENIGIITTCPENKYSFSACYYDIDNPNDILSVKTGWPDKGTVKQNSLLLPSSHRTVAEDYADGVKSYAYWGVGGLSWGIPYLCGVMALAWQINPNISFENLLKVMFEEGIEKDNNKIICPGAVFKILYQNLSPDEEEKSAMHNM